MFYSYILIHEIYFIVIFGKIINFIYMRESIITYFSLLALQIVI